MSHGRSRSPEERTSSPAGDYRPRRLGHPHPRSNSRPSVSDHAQQETARCLLDECGAEYLITAVKENQPTMLEDLRGMDFSACPMVETLDKEHGRIELRRYWVKDLSGAEWDGYADLYGPRRTPAAARQDRQDQHRGELRLTSLGPRQATPQQLANLLRNHCLSRRLAERARRV